MKTSETFEEAKFIKIYGPRIEENGVSKVDVRVIPKNECPDLSEHSFLDYSVFAKERTEIWVPTKELTAYQLAALILV